MYSDPLCINRQLWSSVQFVLGGSKWSVEARRQLGFNSAFLLKLYHRRDEGNLAKGRITFAPTVGSVVEILLRPSHPLVTFNCFLSSYRISQTVNLWPYVHITWMWETDISSSWWHFRWWCDLYGKLPVINYVPELMADKKVKFGATSKEKQSVIHKQYEFVKHREYTNRTIQWRCRLYQKSRCHACLVSIFTCFFYVFTCVTICLYYDSIAADTRDARYYYMTLAVYVYMLYVLQILESGIRKMFIVSYW